MEKVYISGKVTGLPWEEVEKKFMEAAKVVRCHGSLAVVPVHYCMKDWTWRQCMKRCLALLLECDKVLLLPDWKQSQGAKIEALVALACGIPVLKLKRYGTH